MQRRIRQRRRCSKANNKVIFNSELDAKIALSRRRDDHQREKVPKRAYPCCPECGRSECEHTVRKHWHVTSEKERTYGNPRPGFKDEERESPEFQEE